MPVLAIGLVDLVVFIGALAVVIILISGWSFLSLVSAVLRHLPLIGGQVASVVTGWAQQEMTALNAVWVDLVKPVAHFFWMLSVGVWHLLYQMVQTIADAKQWAVNAQQAAQNALAQGLAAAAAAIGSAATYTDQQVSQAIGQATAYAAAELGVAESYTDAVASELLGDAQSVYNQAVAYTNVVASELVGDIDSAYNQAVATAVGLADTVQSEAVTLFGQAVTDAQVWTDQVLSDAQGLYNDAVAHADQVAAAAEAGALAAVLPQIAAITTELTECVEPLCETVTPNANELGGLGSLLQAIDGLFDALLLGALLEQAVADPKGTATAVVDVTGWMSSLGTDLARAVGAVA